MGISAFEKWNTVMKQKKTMSNIHTKFTEFSMVKE